MKKNECNVVRDLMPLVLDRVASDESRELIEEHIASCEECRKQYDEMRSALPEETRVEYEEDRKQFTDALKSVRKQRLKRRIRMIALAAIVCLAVMLAGLFAYDALFWKMSIPVDNSLYTLSLCEMKDGRYIVTADSSRIGFNTMTQSETIYEDGKDICYIRFQAAPIHPDSGTKIGPEKWAVMEIENNGEESDDEIRQGTPGNYVTVWKAGQSIPAASEEMERYYALDRTYWQWFNTLPVTEEGHVDISNDEFFAWQDRLEEARMAVPEWN